MSEQSRLDAGARLAGDLRRIRERQNLSIGDLHAETKIPRSLLESFEERALFDHAQFNRVYLRSFVRTYAVSVGVEPETAADALEQAFEGAYSGELARKYLGESMEDEPVDTPDSPTSPPPATIEREFTQTAGGSRSGGRGSRPPDEPKAAPETDDGAADWAATSPPARKARPERRPRPDVTRRRARSGFRGWGYVILGIIIVAGLVWLFTSVLMPSAEQSDAQTTGLAADAEVEPEPVEEAPPPRRETPVLGDSLVFYIVASNGPVDPIRVTVDDDLRRPYWIEEGDSMRFAASNRIVFEERLDRVRLNLQGHAYPTSRRDDRDRVVVTRDSAEAFFARLGE